MDSWLNCQNSFPASDFVNAFVKFTNMYSEHILCSNFDFTFIK